MGLALVTFSLGLTLRLVFSEYIWHLNIFGSSFLVSQ